MRKIKIVRINAIDGVQGTIEISGDFTSIFKGKFYRNDLGDVLPSFTDPAVAGYQFVPATTFEIIQNKKYRGRYTVYSPANAVDGDSSSFSNGKTTIRVNELVPPLIQSDVGSVLTDGYITNISTYLLKIGTNEIVVPPGVNITGYPIEFMGRGSSGWGEAFTQNFLDLSTNFASASQPVNGFTGQTWYDSDNKELRIFDGTTWDLVNRTAYGTTALHTQSNASNMWTINHLLNLPAPHIAFVQFFVDRGLGPQLILPADVTFDNANQITATFSNQEIGYVLVRQ